MPGKHYILSLVTCIDYLEHFGAHWLLPKLACIGTCCDIAFLVFLLAAVCLVVFMQAFVLCSFSALLVSYQMMILAFRGNGLESTLEGKFEYCTMLGMLRFLNVVCGEIAIKSRCNEWT